MPLVLGERPFADLALGVLLDRRLPLLERLGRDVDQQRLPAMLRKDVRDAVPHRAVPDDGDFAHPASQVRGCFTRLPMTARIPAISTIVPTMPPSGPNVPPSTHSCAPGLYSTAGTRNM